MTHIPPLTELKINVHIGSYRHIYLTVPNALWINVAATHTPPHWGGDDLFHIVCYLHSAPLGLNALGMNTACYPHPAPDGA